jgi:hypothetical protein
VAPTVLKLNLKLVVLCDRKPAFLSHDLLHACDAGKTYLMVQMEWGSRGLKNM